MAAGSKPLLAEVYPAPLIAVDRLPQLAVDQGVEVRDDLGLDPECAAEPEELLPAHDSLDFGDEEAALLNQPDAAMKKLR